MDIPTVTMTSQAQSIPSDAPTMGSESQAPTRFSYKQLLRNHKISRGMPVEPEPLQYSDHELMEEGAILLHKLYSKVVILYPPNPKYNTEKHIVKKWGIDAVEEEAESMRIAEAAGIRVPHVYAIETASDGRRGIVMDYVDGDMLKHVWQSLNDEEKTSVKRQLRQVLEKMQSLEPPKDHIGGPRPGDRIRDTRIMMTETAPAVKDEKGFNDYLLSAVFRAAPKYLRAAFASVLQTDHRIVFTHNDLAPRNIMYKDGVITIIDWQDGGWYPEYWEYVKFFYRAKGDDLRDDAEDFFPKTYPLDLVHYIALLHWQPS
ncbi:phosphotransferase enzyme family protein [Ophiostoma piceae UAMH 11346]|uniref:Phosphotransferase enzyme family protein n=1 Tax=Ophiostoma piceae (strain UAMH 11346) TaxID=1262450 RepID=S3BU98_OPHP1|nr:phosphotransferase enzyme family protein [Ophiostoma piceae UAMH 11346]